MISDSVEENSPNQNVLNDLPHYLHSSSWLCTAPTANIQPEENEMEKLGLRLIKQGSGSRRMRSGSNIQQDKKFKYNRIIS